MRIISGTFKGKKILQPIDSKTRPLKDIAFLVHDYEEYDTYSSYILLTLLKNKKQNIYPRSEVEISVFTW